MIEIRTFRSRRRIRIDLWRQYKEADPKGKIKYFRKRVGGFPQENGCPPDLLAELDAQEILQLENWFAEVNHAEKNYGAKPDELIKISLLVAPQLHQEAFIELPLDAKKKRQNFNPHETMLEALSKRVDLLKQAISHQPNKPPTKKRSAKKQ